MQHIICDYIATLTNILLRINKLIQKVDDE